MGLSEIKWSRRERIPDTWSTTKCSLCQYYRAAQKAKGNFRLAIKETENKCSRDNLLCYLALRKHDLSDLQLRLAEQGLSSLGMLEGEVLVSIEQVLKHFGIRHGNTSSLCKINSKSANLLLGKRSKLLFGSPSKGRRTYIMVTLDSTDIYQHELIEQLLEGGMDIGSYQLCT